MMSVRWTDQAYQDREAMRNYHARLVTCHGHERAKAILAGKDPATNADLELWRNLGRRR